MYQADEVFVRHMPFGSPVRDSVGLEYSLRAGEIHVSYPPSYGASFPIGQYPASYETAPPNEITRERVALWRALSEQADQAATAALEH
jgi:hypothetical protein